MTSRTNGPPGEKTHLGGALGCLDEDFGLSVVPGHLALLSAKPGEEALGGPNMFGTRNS